MDIGYRVEITLKECVMGLSELDALETLIRTAQGSGYIPVRMAYARMREKKKEYESPVVILQKHPMAKHYGSTPFELPMPFETPAKYMVISENGMQRLHHCIISDKSTVIHRLKSVAKEL